MRISTTLRFGCAVAVVTLGSWMLVSGGRPGFATICFAAPSVLLLNPREATRPLPPRAQWPLVGLAIGFVGVIMFLRWVVPEATGERVLRHPATAVSLWALMLCAIMLRWRRERSTVA